MLIEPNAVRFLHKLVNSGNLKWVTVPTGTAPCHPKMTSFQITNGSTEMLEICGMCLQSYLWSNGQLVGPGNLELSCTKCRKKSPYDDFISKNGKRTTICGDCRREWARQKYRDEKRRSEFQDFAMDAAKRDLIDRVKRWEP